MVFVIRKRHGIFVSNQVTGDEEDRPGYVARMEGGDEENGTLS